jgi:hypothetical protein
VADHSPLASGGFAGVFMGSDYKVFDVVRVEEFHEFDVFEGGTRLLTNLGGSVALPVATNDRGRQMATAAERTGFRVVDLETDQRLFEWVTLEHLTIEESTHPRPELTANWWEPL